MTTELTVRGYLQAAIACFPQDLHGGWELAIANHLQAALDLDAPRPSREAIASCVQASLVRLRENLGFTPPEMENHRWVETFMLLTDDLEELVNPQEVAA